MVNYYTAGTQWASRRVTASLRTTRAGRPSPCRAQTTPDLEEIPARTAKCTAAGKPEINKLKFDSQDAATSAVVTGRADAFVADSPVTQYQVKNTKGKLELAGDVYDVVLYGMPIAKENAKLGAAMVKALESLEADGTYQKILDKYGVEKGAVPRSAPTAPRVERSELRPVGPGPGADGDRTRDRRAAGSERGRAPAASRQLRRGGGAGRRLGAVPVRRGDEPDLQLADVRPLPARRAGDRGRPEHPAADCVLDGQRRLCWACCSPSCACHRTACCSGSRGSTCGSSAERRSTCSWCSGGCSPPSTRRSASGSRSADAHDVQHPGRAERLPARGARAGAQRGGVHGRDRAGRHHRRRRGADRGGHRAGHVRGRRCAHRAAPGDAGHHPADRQRGDHRCSRPRRW